MRLLNQLRHDRKPAKAAAKHCDAFRVGNAFGYGPLHALGDVFLQAAVVFAVGCVGKVTAIAG